MSYILIFHAKRDRRGGGGEKEKMRVDRCYGFVVIYLF